MIDHTIAMDATSRAHIELVNQMNGYFHLEEQAGEHPLTEYRLTINNPSALNFSSTEADATNNRISDIVLAMNLTLARAALSLQGLDLSRRDINQ